MLKLIWFEVIINHAEARNVQYVLTFTIYGSLLNTWSTNISSILFAPRPRQFVPQPFRLILQVSGELSNNGQPMRRFMQTFVLAPQSPKKYYVHNDIFRYQVWLEYIRSG